MIRKQRSASITERHHPPAPKIKHEGNNDRYLVSFTTAIFGESNGIEIPEEQTFAPISSFGLAIGEPIQKKGDKA